MGFNLLIKIISFSFSESYVFLFENKKFIDRELVNQGEN